MAPFALFGGVLIKGMKKYRPANVLGWIILVVGLGLMSLLKANSSTGQWVGFQIISSAGAGFIVSPSSTFFLTDKITE